MTTLDAAFAELVDAAVDKALARIVPELEASMRHLRPLAVDTTGAGKLLGVSERTARQLVVDGLLPKVPHLGSRVLIPVTAIQKFVDGEETTPVRPIRPSAAPAA